VTQRIAVRSDEAAEGDRLGADPGDDAAQPIDVARLELALAIVELSPSGDLGIELLADRPGEGGDEIARDRGSAPPSSARRRPRSRRAEAGDRIDLGPPHPHPDRDQPVGLLDLTGGPRRLTIAPSSIRSQRGRVSVAIRALAATSGMSGRGSAVAPLVATSSRFSASARLARTKPALSPQSWRTPSKVSAWNGWVPISAAMASVSWISPPAPRSPRRGSRITSGWRM
jgi:hypothetical protein